SALAGRGPYVLVELDGSDLPPHPIDGLAEHRRTGLYLQPEITTDESAFRPAPEQVTWETVASGTQATGVQDQRFEIIASQQQLVSFWTRAHASQLQPPPLPDADFRRETLVAIFMGQRPTGGHAVEVRRVSDERGELYLDVAFVAPAAGAMTTQAVTSPWTLVRVLRGGYPVAWIRDASDGTLVGVARRTARAAASSARPGSAPREGPRRVGAGLTWRRPRGPPARCPAGGGPGPQVSS